MQKLGEFATKVTVRTDDDDDDNVALGERMDSPVRLRGYEHDSTNFTRGCYMMNHNSFIDLTYVLEPIIVYSILP